MTKIFFASLPLSFFSRTALAVNYSIPAISPQPASAGPAGWISNLYQFSLMGAGLLAFGVIVYAGFRFALSAGNPSKQSDARDQIEQALLGLLLLLGAYIILNTINPNLVNLPDVKKLLSPVTGSNVSLPSSNNNVPAPTCNEQAPCYKCGNNPTCWTDANSCRAACGATCALTSAGCPTP